MTLRWDPAAEPKSWTWTDPATRQARNEHIIELWQLGYSRRDIARHYDISPARVSQIVNSFGCGWR
jgi:Mor family transcriptional regulator